MTTLHSFALKIKTGKILRRMFKMQIDQNNFRKNITTNKKHVLRKMSLKFQNPNFNISCKITCNVLSCYKMLTLWT